ncbi:MAG: hypothetical protein C4320_09270 [Armatimonadota bacterium]
MITGTRIPDPRVGGSGTFFIWITADANFVAYETREKFTIGNPGEAPVAKDLLVISRWEANLQLNTPIKAEVFKFTR